MNVFGGDFLALLRVGSESKLCQENKIPYELKFELGTHKF